MQAGRRKSKTGEAKERAKRRKIEAMTPEERMVLALELGERNALWLKLTASEKPSEDE